MKPMTRYVLGAGFVIGLATFLPALAQQGPTYKLTEHAFNAGGHPANGTILSSATFRVSIDAIGDSVAMKLLSGPTYRMEGSFVAAYPPPGEVFGLQFTAPDTLAWDGERSAGVYNLYRDTMSELSSLGYGECHQPGLFGRTTSETEVPPSGDGFFYLVTVENRLGEEGTKGFANGIGERANTAPCP